VDLGASQLVLYLLIFIRVMSIIAVAPVLGHQAIPVQIKVALGLFAALVLEPVLQATHPAVPLQLGPLVIAAAAEAAVGLLLGFVMGFILLGVDVAGDMISFDLGLTMATVLDPETGVQNPVLTEFLRLVMTLVLLMLNGHHFILQALRLSFDTVALGGFTVTGAAADTLVAMSGKVLLIGIKLAAPVIVASFLMNVALGVLTRVAPQINVFILSFQLKIGVGLLVLLTTAPMMVYVFKNLLAGFEENMLALVKAL
jgi:flagellar biosynthetic protein FliR